MSKFTRILRQSKDLIILHAPEILTATSIVGTVAGTIFAAKATPKALILLNEAEAAKGAELTFPEKVKACWKVYIPAAGTVLMSAGCAIGATRTSLGRNAALLSLYSASETALKEYQDKVVEKIGEKKAQAITDAVNSDKVQQVMATNPSDKSIIRTGFGEELCLDLYSGRLFYSDIESLRRAENDINKNLIGNMVMSLNEAYGYMNLPSIKAGYDVGFTVDNDVHLAFGSELLENGKVVLTVDFRNPPMPGYNKLW